jgi:hypothetical protein
MSPAITASASIWMPNTVMSALAPPAWRRMHSSGGGGGELCGGAAGPRLWVPGLWGRRQVSAGRWATHLPGACCVGAGSACGRAGGSMHGTELEQVGWCGGAGGWGACPHNHRWRPPATHPCNAAPPPCLSCPPGSAAPLAAWRARAAWRRATPPPPSAGGPGFPPPALPPWPARPGRTAPLALPWPPAPRPHLPGVWAAMRAALEGGAAGWGALGGAWPAAAPGLAAMRAPPSGAAGRAAWQQHLQPGRWLGRRSI